MRLWGLRTGRDLEVLVLTRLKWVDWVTNGRPLEPLGHVPPTTAEAKLYDLADQVGQA